MPDDQRAANEQLDGSGSATDGDGSEEDTGQGSVSTGDRVDNAGSDADGGNPDEATSGRSELRSSGMGDATEQVGDDEPVQYEGVTAAQFDEGMQLVSDHIDACTTASALVVVAVFACVGVMAVQTLVRSFETRD